MEDADLPPGFAHLGTGVISFDPDRHAPINAAIRLEATEVGNAGDNVITVTDGADFVNGGLGIDRLVVDYHLATGAVTGDSTSNFTEAGGLSPSRSPPALSRTSPYGPARAPTRSRSATATISSTRAPARTRSRPAMV